MLLSRTRVLPPDRNLTCLRRWSDIYRKPWPVGPFTHTTSRPSDEQLHHGTCSVRCRCFKIRQHVTHYTLISLAEQSKAKVCGWPLFGTAGSNPACGMDICLLRVLCRGLCDGPIPRLEESFRLWHVWSRNPTIRKTWLAIRCFFFGKTNYTV